MSQALGSWIDGAVDSFVPADDRGLQYGDGVFETILVRNGIARFLALHRERMQRGLTRLGIPFRPDAALDADIAPAIAMAPPLAVLKIIITRGSAARRGYAPSDRHARARRIVTLWPSEPLAPELIEQGASLDIARLRLPESSPFAGLKHLNRLENVMAAAEMMSNAATLDSLLMDIGDRIVSGTSSNVFLVKSGELLTPPVNRVGIAGVMRA